MNWRAVCVHLPCSRLHWGWRRSTGCTTSRRGRSLRRCCHCQGCWSPACRGTSWKSPAPSRWSPTHGGGIDAPRLPHCRRKNSRELYKRYMLVVHVFGFCFFFANWCMTATWSSGRGRVCACCSSPPGGCGGCSLPGCSAHVCVRCPARTPSAGRRNRPCTPSSCGRSSQSRQHAAGSPSSHHLKGKKNGKHLVSHLGYRCCSTPGVNAPPSLPTQLLLLTHRPCPYRSRPPQTCRPATAPLCRDLISSLHCSRWRHSQWDSSSHAGSLKIWDRGQLE